MQLGLIQFLLGNSAGAPASGGDAGAAAGGDLFSALLGEAGGQGAAAGGPQAQAGAALGGAALLGQQVDRAALEQALQESMRAKAVTPDMARQLLTKLDGVAEGGESATGDLLRGMQGGLADEAGDEEEVFAELREALEAIAEGGEPQTVGEIVDQLPSMETTDEARAPLMQRVLGLLNHAIEKTREYAPQVAAAAAAVTPDVTAQTLQASLLRPDDATASQPDEARGEDPIESADAPDAPLVVITPLAQVQTAAIPEWVRKIGDDATPTPSLDLDIPPLVEPAAAEDESLPEVTLPGAVKKPATLANASTSAEPRKHNPAFAEHLAALPEALDAMQADAEPLTQQQPVSTVDQTGAIGTQLPPSSHSSITPQTHGSLEHLAPHRAAAEQVQVAITTATKDGLDRLTLQLEPADLGRVEVRMETGLDGQTTLSFIVDKAETLDALSRDARSLERSLQEAGIKADAGGMQFNLRQQPNPEAQFSDMMGGQGKSRQQAANDNDSATVASAAEGITTHYTINVREGVDIHA
jgi:flagellar hook-length control protein FliK